MNNDTFTLIAGGLLSVLVGQVTAEQTDLFNFLSNLSASAVLAVTFWWLMKRVETRLDEAFKDYKELVLDVLKTMKDKYKDKDSDNE